MKLKKAAAITLTGGLKCPRAMWFLIFHVWKSIKRMKIRSTAVKSFKTACGVLPTEYRKNTAIGK